VLLRTLLAQGFKMTGVAHARQVLAAPGERAFGGAVINRMGAMR
jgi:hypothetical protein